MSFFKVTSAFVGFLLLGTSAFADTISATGGLSFGRNSGLNYLKSPGPMFGLEYALPVSSSFQFGGFFDYSTLTSITGHSDSIQFMGMLARIQFGNEGSIRPYIDGKLGVARRQEDDLDSGMKPAWGVGTGFMVPVSKVMSIGPRFDIKYIPNSADSNAGPTPALDAGLMFSFKI